MLAHRHSSAHHTVRLPPSVGAAVGCIAEAAGVLALVVRAHAGAPAVEAVAALAVVLADRTPLAVNAISLSPPMLAQLALLDPARPCRRRRRTPCCSCCSSVARPLPPRRLLPHPGCPCTRWAGALGRGSWREGRLRVAQRTRAGRAPVEAADFGTFPARPPLPVVGAYFGAATVLALALQPVVGADGTPAAVTAIVSPTPVSTNG
mmetsp:Transcript_43457/g.102625  ORF Transcript_43457/g.102625 Transcript_43457/m.102625 type:complete len:206 (-) Transcript_43457:19-636(-)